MCDNKRYSLFANRKWRIKVILKPQDIFVLLKLVALKSQKWTYNTLAVDLEMSPSEVHAAVKRSRSAHLAIEIENSIQPNLSCLEEFMIYGLKYVFIPDRGGLTRGMPTGYAASPLKELLSSSGEPPPVWPDSLGEVRGESFSPLYKSVPNAARKDQKLYEFLALVDAIRDGRPRERELAIREIRDRLTA
jgi:hypothetical protein